MEFPAGVSFSVLCSRFGLVEAEVDLCRLMSGSSLDTRPADLERGARTRHAVFKHQGCGRRKVKLLMIMVTEIMIAATRAAIHTLAE